MNKKDIKVYNQKNYSSRYTWGKCIKCKRRTTTTLDDGTHLCLKCKKKMVKNINDKFNDSEGLDTGMDKYEELYNSLLNSEEYKIAKKLKKEGINEDSIMGVIKASKRTNKDESKEYVVGDSSIKMLVFGDTHIGHKKYKPSLMNHAVSMAKKEKVDMIVCTGDIADGWYQNRPAAIFEQNAIGFDNQMDMAVKEFSKFKKLDIPLYYITGNHEYNTFVRGAGVEFGNIFKMRLDKIGMENYYIGNGEGNLKLRTGTKIKLLHPDGGTAYAISYKSQKIIESLQGAGEKLPDAAFIGHFHKSEYIPYQGVHTFQTGTLCDQTKFMRGKGIPAHLGFWIVDIDSDKKGKITSITPKYYPGK